MADSIKTQNLFIQKQIDAEKASKKRNEEFLANDEVHKNYEKSVTVDPNADYFRITAD